jgi:hypothetical protein
MSIDLECAASVAAAVECVALDVEHAQKNRAMSAGERVLQSVTGFLILRLKRLAGFFLIVALPTYDDSSDQHGY